MTALAIGIAIGALGTVLAAVIVARLYAWANPIERERRVDAEDGGW